MLAIQLAAALALHANTDANLPMYGLAASTTDDGIVTARQMVPPANAPQTGAIASESTIVHSRIIYLNHTGATLRPGDNDARTNHSTLVPSMVTFPAWNVTDSKWHDTMSCVQSMFARWDVTVTDEDPGNVPHLEAIIGGGPELIGMPDYLGGVSPFNYDCSPIENSIVFAFPDNLLTTAERSCEIISQEIAHSYGLDHELLPSDPMTYLAYNHERTFQDQSVSCGEQMSHPRSCGIAGHVCSANQNSVQLLDTRLGLADGVPPDPADPDYAGQPDDDDDRSDLPSNEILGGCNSGRGTGTGSLLLLGLALVPALRRRRR